MRKILVILAIIMVTFSLVGCGKGNAKTESSEIGEINNQENETGGLEGTIEPTKQITETQITEELTATATPTEESQGFEVDEGLLNVTITIPAFIFEDVSDFDPDAYVEENDFKKAVVNEDGSVTVTMSKKRHNELMADYKTEVDKIFDEMVEAEDTPYIKEITSTKGYKTVTVRVDKGDYEDAWDMTPLSIYFSVALYQIFDNIEPYCEVIIEDVETGEVLDSVIYPDAFED